MRKNWIWIAAFLLLLASAGGWYVASPAWTLRQMAAAAKAHDADKLSGYVDYSKLRASTKSQVKAAMTAKIASGASRGFGSLGLMVGRAVVDQLIDAILTPEGVAAMFAAEQAGTIGTRVANKKPLGLDASNREIVHDGVDQFRLHQPGKPGQDGDLIFERHGLSWKLARIQVPEGLLDEGQLPNAVVIAPHAEAASAGQPAARNGA